MKARKFRKHFLNILKNFKNSENQNISKAESQKINLKLEKYLIHNLKYLSLELTGNKGNSSKILNQILIEYFGEQ